MLTVGKAPTGRYQLKMMNGKGPETRDFDLVLVCLPAPRRPPYLAIAARQLADPLVALLVAAAAVSTLIGEGLEALVIAAIVVLDAVLGFVQEAGAERAVLALRSALQPTASLIRGGREQELPADEIAKISHENAAKLFRHPLPPPGNPHAVGVRR